ncbi:DNA-formamidopyrimidine glycosylase [Picosynechococcus sp. PCC 73109]|uniref:DNA-formamidopyrimidine glycosylase n=1 Tax=Picosynechococcus sp. PCC 73109 TaxID=374982 RepID=UPI0007458BA8|nr:DNA-formamidopyrimidine glycosylase [Picosynechococcus sp. PCC 73109]AMA09488.1 formamidopyrimidine-DNA glycosylase [Picosynechococcus sp. PCC 73109]
MPELPEVETVRRGLMQISVNQRFTGAEILLRKTLAHPVDPDHFLGAIQGLVIQDWQRRGKYLLGKLSDGSTLGIHLRMTGKFLWTTPDVPVQKHTRMRFFIEGDRELRFVDLRTFGQIWWVPAGTIVESVITGLTRLGVEPLSPDFTADVLATCCEKRQRPMKTFLLDQSIVTGLGNIYADEALFKSGIHPTRKASSLKISEIEKLHKAIVEVLETSIAQGGTTFSDFVSTTGTNGNYGGMALTYGRTGEPCRVCSHPIERIKLGGRSTHFCPQCQS